MKPLFWYVQEGETKWRFETFYHAYGFVKRTGLKGVKMYRR